MVQDTGGSSAQLAREVRHELLLLPYYSVFDWLEFEVQPDGTVILRGQAIEWKVIFLLAGVLPLGNCIGENWCCSRKIATLEV